MSSDRGAGRSAEPAASRDRSSAPTSSRTGTVPAMALVPVRLFFGATFLYAGFDKLLDPNFFNAASSGSIQSQFQAFIRVSPLSELVRLAQPFAVELGFLIAVAEIAIGVGALTGIAFRLAAAGGAAISLLFFLTASWATRPFYFGADLPYAAGWLALALAGHGGVLIPERLRTSAASGGRAGARRRPDGHSRAAPEWRAARAAEPGAVPLLERRMILQAGVLGAIAAVLTSLAVPLRLMGLSTGGLTATVPGTTPGPGAGTTPGPGTTAGPAVTAGPGVSAGPGATAGPATSALAVANVSDFQSAPSRSFTVPLAAPAPLPAGDPGIVIKLGDGSYAAYDAVCTHAGCTVDWDAVDGVILCPCHGAAFDATRAGAVLQGPTRTPLTQLPLTIDTATGQISLKV
jgi:thiosulfate dehydrogenase (quinone) large subunit